MVDLDCKTKMVSSDLPSKSPKFSNGLKVSIPSTSLFGCVSRVSPAPASDSACSAYEYYVRLPELTRLWTITEFPDWKNEAVLRPSLQALEITFRFISTVLIDPRPYSNRSELSRRVESLARSQIKLIGILCEDEERDSETRGRVPIVDLKTSNGVLAREDSYAEVWRVPGETEATVVNKTSEVSLLPRLATWQKSEDIATSLFYAIECDMRRCSYTLGLGEPNLSGKPNLEYDVVCRPNELHALKKPPYENNIDNYENNSLYTTHQILESWIHVSNQLTKRVVENIERQRFAQAANGCYVVEKIWKLLEEIEDLHLMMDPDDFLRLKNQLELKSITETQPFCFRSRALVEITKACKELKHKVPEILEVEVDPRGGPRVQEAAMRLYGEKKEVEKIRLLQGMQGIEVALKRFFFAYKQVLVMVMGSVEAKGNKGVTSCDGSEPLSQLFLEPTYYPSLDAAKTFLGEMWSQWRKQ